MFLVASPRARRRLIRFGAVGIVCAVVAVVFVLLPNTNGRLKSTFSNAPVQRVVTERQVPVTHARRVAVDKLFDAFVPAAIERRDPAAAYDLVTPAFRGGATRAAWRRGAVPVSFYRPRGRTFHGWTVDASYRTTMSVQLFMQPRDPKEGAADFSIDLRRLRGRWLIDSLYERATYPTAAAAPPSKAGHRKAVAPPATLFRPAKRGLMWVLILALFSLIVAVPVCFLAVQWFVARRVRVRRAAEWEPLPPLRKSGARPDEPVAVDGARRTDDG
jgi:hypothetical protein